MFGRNVGKTVAVCTDTDCPVHNPHVAAQRAADPPPVIEAAREQETEEEAAQRKAEHEQQMARYEAEQGRREEERKAEFERQQQEYEAEQVRREKQRKARVVTFEGIIEQARHRSTPHKCASSFAWLSRWTRAASLTALPLTSPVAMRTRSRPTRTLCWPRWATPADEKLTGFALRIVLSDHIGIPHESQPDLLIEAEQVFALRKPKACKSKAAASAKAKPVAVKATGKKEAASKKAA